MIGLSPDISSADYYTPKNHAYYLYGYNVLICVSLKISTILLNNALYLMSELFVFLLLVENVFNIFLKHLIYSYKIFIKGVEVWVMCLHDGHIC